MPELLSKGRKDTQENSLDRASGEKCSVGMENGVAPSDEKPPNLPTIYKSSVLNWR